MLITLRDATVTFDGVARPALDRVSLSIHPRTWTAIVGPNGSGKSTLLSALAGLVPLRTGSREAIGAPRVALLQQDADNQLVAKSVRHELMLSVPLQVVDLERHSRIDAAIERFDLTPLLERNPHRLSGGEKQRLACATVWLEKPDVLLLDEPLAFLDADARARAIAFVRDAYAGGTAVVWATPGDDAELARDVVYLDLGRTVTRNPAPATGTDAPKSLGAPRRRSRAARERTDAALRIEGVSFAYDGNVVLQSIDLDVAKGECVGVVGRNSAGKSTLLLLAGGALKPASGRVVRGPGGVLYLSQSPERMFFAETVREEIAFGLRHGAGRRGMNRVELDAVVNESLRAVGFDPADVSGRSPFQLSFGEMRRVAFAIAHAMAPDLLLLDEPASSLDRAGRAVLEALVSTRLEAGASVVVASHDPFHLEGLCDRVVQLANGRLEGV